MNLSTLKSLLGSFGSGAIYTADAVSPIISYVKALLTIGTTEPPPPSPGRNEGQWNLGYLDGKWIFLANDSQVRVEPIKGGAIGISRVVCALDVSAANAASFCGAYLIDFDHNPLPSDTGVGDDRLHKKMVIEFEYQMGANPASDADCIGLGVQFGFNGLSNDVILLRRGAGAQLNFVTDVAGAETVTAIPVTRTNTNLFRIELTREAGVQRVKLFAQGQLRANHTANISQNGWLHLGMYAIGGAGAHTDRLGPWRIWYEDTQRL